MAAIAVTLERRARIVPMVLLTYAVIATVLIALFVTLRAAGSTTTGTPRPRPQTGPPVTVVAPITEDAVR